MRRLLFAILALSLVAGSCQPVFAELTGPALLGPDLASTDADQGMTLVANGIRTYNVVSYGATGDGSTNDQTAIEEAIAAADAGRDAPIYFPPGDYAVTGLTIDFPVHIIMDPKARLVPHSTMAAGDYLLTIDGTTADAGDLEEYCIRVTWSNLWLDGVDRANDVGGLKIKRWLRSFVGMTVIENCARSAINFADISKEVVFSHLRTWKCGTASATPSEDFPTLDFRQAEIDVTPPPYDSVNNIFFLAMNLNYSYGTDIYIDAADGNQAAGLNHPRNITFQNFQIHGPFEGAALSPALTSYQINSRKQIILGSCDRIKFLDGVIRYGSDAAVKIHVIPGTDSGYSTQLVEFVGVDFAGARYTTGTNYHGVDLDDGTIYWDRNTMREGYTGYDAVNAASGVDVYWSLIGNTVATGSVTITDRTTVYFRKTDVDFGSMEATGFSSITGKALSSASLTVKGQATDTTKREAFRVKYGETIVRAQTHIPATGILTFDNDASPPSAAGMVAESIDGAFNVTSGQLRWFNGTDWKYVPRSDGETGGTGSAGAGNQYVEIEVNGTTYKVLHDGTL